MGHASGDGQRPARWSRAPATTPAALAVISVGGALGALARYGLASALPTAPAGFPWATFWTNVSGCLLIGALLALIAHVPRAAHPLLRPFLGIGVLGGYTTFSTYSVEIQRLTAHGAAGTALLYLAGTLAAALAAVYAGAASVRALRPGGRPSASPSSE